MVYIPDFRKMESYTMVFGAMMLVLITLIMAVLYGIITYILMTTKPILEKYMPMEHC